MVPTVPYTPKQNGVSERMNRTLMEKVRTFLHESQASLSLWGEALYASVYVTNRSPTSALSTARTPFEMWFGSKPNVRKLKVFGCVAYSHITKEHRSKLDDRSQTLAFVGYAPNGYRLWDSVNNEIKISRDVIFDECRPFFGSNGQEITSDKGITCCEVDSPTISEPCEEQETVDNDEECIEDSDQD